MTDRTDIVFFYLFLSRLQLLSHFVRLLISVDLSLTLFFSSVVEINILKSLFFSNINNCCYCTNRRHYNK